MRAHEFILLEYNQQKTIQNFGENLMFTFAGDDNAVQGTLDRNSEIYKVVEIVRRAMDGKIDLDNATWKQYEQIVAKYALDQIEQFDPTNHKEYVQWMVKNYITKNIKRYEDFGRVNAALNRFNNLKKRKKLQPEHRDINRLNFDQLQDILETTYAQEAEESSNEEQRTLSAKMKQESELFYEDDTVTVIIPKTETASCYYGRGTRWCTASTDSFNYFERYSRDGSLYILFPKKPLHVGEKYQLHFSTDQFMDEDDDSVDLERLAGRFPQLFEKFKQTEDLGKYLLFGDETVINQLLDTMRPVIEEYADEVISDIEHSDDDYYSEMQAKHSELDSEGEPTGDIDWEAVAEAGDDYMSYNYSVGEELKEINDVLNLDAAGIKNYADFLRDQDSGEMLEIDNLETVMSYIIKDETSGRRYGSGLGDNVSEWIDSNLAIRKYDSNWVVLRKHTISKKYPDDHKNAGQYYKSEEWKKVS